MYWVFYMKISFVLVYHFTNIQALDPDDYAPRVLLCRWMLNSEMEQYHLLINILNPGE